MKIEMHGSVSISADVRTVQDLCDLLSYLKKYQVAPDTPIDAGSHIWIEPKVHGIGFIECGEHIPPDEIKNDVLLELHGHVDDVDKYGEEARPE
jgi:hypothetical protein